MALKPIDMQVLLPKLHKQDALKPRVIHKIENEQLTAQAETRQETDKKLNRVNTFDQKDHPKVKPDPDRQSKSQDEKPDSKEKKSEEEKHESEKRDKTTVKRQHLDIKV